MVFKNLSKDPILYTKDGQFGVKGLGYTTEAPGLGTPKEAKGKYKASGYGDLNEGKYRVYTDDDHMDTKDVWQNEDGTWPEVDYKWNLTGEYEDGVYDEDSVEESKLRKVIREMIAEELATTPRTSLKEGVEKELAEINKEAEYEILSSKLQKINDAIERRQSHLGKLDEDEDMKALTDKKKVKELEKDIKSLEKAKDKLEKIINKKGSKAKKTEVIDEVEDDLGNKIRASAEYEFAKEDAENRYDEGEEIDSILSNYPNLSLNDRNTLRQDLEGKMNGMDY
jgi:hypothetical protein